ncbi:MAG TPA: SCO family protein [Methylophilaceae bacterium]|nr:SCO family protein [Methylophilaceae bacterium]
MRRITGVIASFVVAILLTACNLNKEPELYGTDVTGASFANTLSLTDHTGKPRTLEDFKGKVVVLFFGYTQCPDVCPTTMADLAQAMKLLGPKSDEVQVLFVTVDPERDTQQVLAEYVPSFDSRFLGLHGTPEQMAETAKNFKIFYTKVEDKGKSGYTIDHSAGVYVFDKQGHVRIYVKYGQKPAEIAHDLKTLL